MNSIVNYVISGALIIVGIIHLLPLSGVLSVSRLQTLYGVFFDDPNLAILLRHRAMLFGMLGLFFIYAAFRPSLQVLALIAGFASVVSFLWLAYMTGNYNEQVSRVFTADMVAFSCLLIAAVSKAYLRLGS